MEKSRDDADRSMSTRARSPGCTSNRLEWKFNFEVYRCRRKGGTESERANGGWHEEWKGGSTYFRGTPWGPATPSNIESILTASRVCKSAGSARQGRRSLFLAAVCNGIPKYSKYTRRQGSRVPSRVRGVSSKSRNRGIASQCLRTF